MNRNSTAGQAALVEYLGSLGVKLEPADAPSLTNTIYAHTIHREACLRDARVFLRNTPGKVLTDEQIIEMIERVNLGFGRLDEDALRFASHARREITAYLGEIGSPQPWYVAGEMTPLFKAPDAAAKLQAYVEKSTAERKLEQPFLNKEQIEALITRVLGS